MESTPLQDERELAARLNVSISTLRNWRVARRGPRFLKLGRAVRYRESDIAEFMAAGERGPERAA